MTKPMNWERPCEGIRKTRSNSNEYNFSRNCGLSETIVIGKNRIKQVSCPRSPSLPYQHRSYLGKFRLGQIHTSFGVIKILTAAGQSQVKRQRMCLIILVTFDTAVRRLKKFVFLVGQWNENSTHTQAFVIWNGSQLEKNDFRILV
jgi:hypothetical protein